MSSEFNNRMIRDRTIRWTSTCPHGYEIEEWFEDEPGFREHGAYTKCPICRRNL